MDAIVSVTRNWGIGLAGDLAVSNRADMKRFVNLTCGGVRPKDAMPGQVLGTVIMGRKTFQSFPSGPLKARRNVVISRDPSFYPEGVDVVRTPQEALALVQDTSASTVWLIGGQSIYEQLLDACTRVHVTMNDVVVPVDAYFPNLDEREDWALEAEEPGGVTDEGIPFTYRTYRKVH